MRADYSELYIDGHHFFMTHGHLYDEDHMPLLQSGDILMYGHYQLDGGVGAVIDADRATLRSALLVEVDADTVTAAGDLAGVNA